MVSLEGQGSLSTRKGNVVFLEEVLDTAVAKAKAVIEGKNPDLENKDEIASMVGIGAVVFGALCNNKIKDIAFSYDKALSFEGETAPYLQYTHARCCSVIARAGEVSENPDWASVTDEDSFALIKHLDSFENTIRVSAEKYEPSVISGYLLDLAKYYNKFYLANRILGAEPSVMSARLAVTKAVRDTLKSGLALLLIGAPEKM
jgi:arginyl-tRNA synthetase